MDLLRSLVARETIPMPVNWYGNKFLSALRSEQNRRLDLAVQRLLAELKRNLNVSGTGVMKKGVLVRAKSRTRKTIYGAFPSKPGEYPHKQYGTLREQIQIEPGGTRDKPTRKVGPGFITPYGKWLELKDAARGGRPWLVRTFTSVTSQIRAILSAPWTYRG